jgi:hypothetical protein
VSEYDAVVQVISEHLEALDWEIKQLKNERRDILYDPDMGRDCQEYKDVVVELRHARAQRAALWGLIDGLEERVREILQADAMEHGTE